MLIAIIILSTLFVLFAVICFCWLSSSDEEIQSLREKVNNRLYDVRKECIEEWARVAHELAAVKKHATIDLAMLESKLAKLSEKKNKKRVKK